MRKRPFRKHPRPRPREETPTTSSDLVDLAARTRDALRKIKKGFAENPERLSVASLNATLARLLENQAAILDALAALGGRSGNLLGAGGLAGFAIPADAADSSDDTSPEEGPISIPIDAPASDQEEAGDEADDGDEAPSDDAPVAEAEDADALVVPGSTPAEGLRLPGASATAEAPRAVTISVAVDGPGARSFVEAFDNRDNSFERGLEKLNSWLNGGTPFQYRGSRAYLNVSGLKPDSVTHYESLLMSRMGFEVRRGRLVVEGIAGEVLVYEKGSGAAREV